MHHSKRKLPIPITAREFAQTVYRARIEAYDDTIDRIKMALEQVVQIRAETLADLNRTEWHAEEDEEPVNE